MPRWDTYARQFLAALHLFAICAFTIYYLSVQRLLFDAFLFAICAIRKHKIKLAKPEKPAIFQNYETYS